MESADLKGRTEVKPALGFVLFFEVPLMDRGDVYSFMRRCRYGVVSSMSEEGHPQSALVGIAVTEELEIVFDTLNSSRKYRNLIQRPSCSLVVGWDGEQTIQYEGLPPNPRGKT